MLKIVFPFFQTQAPKTDGPRQKRKFSTYFKSLVIELDRELYGPDNHLVEVSSALNNGNETEWSSIWFVIIQVINKICSRPICLITSMITDQIGWHEVLLPINNNYNKISYILFFFLIKTQEILRNFLVAVKKAI